MARRKLRNLDARIIKKVIFYGAKDGIEAISTKRIAKDLGITEPTIYVHFDTKNNLLFSAYKETLAKFVNMQSEMIEQIREQDEDQSKMTLKLWLATMELIEEEKEAYIYLFRYRHVFPPKTFKDQPAVSSFLLECYKATHGGEPCENELVVTELADLLLLDIALGQMPANELVAKASLSILTNGAYSWQSDFYNSLTEANRSKLEERREKSLSDDYEIFVFDE